MLAWIDLETTGLDPVRDQVLEIACIITDDKLEEVARFHQVVYTPVDFAELDPVVQNMHQSSGLWAEVKSEESALRGDADRALAGFLQTYANKAPLAGSTIGFDREFMRFHLPLSLEQAHYRSLDVTSLNEMAQRFWPEAYEKRPRNGTKAHRAMADIEESLRMARHYAAALEQK